MCGTCTYTKELDRLIRLYLVYFCRSILVPELDVVLVVYLDVVLARESPPAASTFLEASARGVEASTPEGRPALELLWCVRACSRVKPLRVL